MFRTPIGRHIRSILIAGIAALLFSVEIRTQTTTQASISGVVLEDGTDQPVADVKVSTDFDYGPGVEAVTDSEGHFTLTGAGSGPQRILTDKAGYAPAKADGRKLPGSPGVWLTPPADKTLKNIIIHVTRLAGISGRVVDRLGHPVPRVEVFAARYAYDVYGERHLQPMSAISGVRNGITNDAGEFRIAGLEPAAYYLVAQPALSVTCAVPGEAFQPTVYYPSATEVSKAETVDIQPGNNYRLPTITLASVPAGSVRIHLIDPIGTIHDDSSKFIALRRKGDEGQSFALGMKPEAYGGPDYIDLGRRAQGSYDVELGWLAPSGLPQILTRKTIDVGETGVSVDVPVISGPSVSLRALMEQPGDDPLSVSGVQYSLLPRDVGIPIKGTTDSNGSFTSESVPAGIYHVALTGLTPDIYVVGLDQSNAPMSSDQIHVGTTDVRLTLNMGRSGGTLDGHASDSRNRKIAGAIAVLVPDVPFRANGFLFRTAITDQDGAFHFRTVAPGAYHLFAWNELEGAAYRSEAFMTKYESSGKAVTIKRNDKQSVDIRLADDVRTPGKEER